MGFTRKMSRNPVLRTAEERVGFQKARQVCIHYVFHNSRRYNSERYWSAVMKRRLANALVDRDDLANLPVIWSCPRLQGLLKYFGKKMLELKHV